MCYKWVKDGFCKLASKLFISSSGLSPVSSKAHWCQIFTHLYVSSIAQISRILANNSLIALHTQQNCNPNLLAIGKVRPVPWRPQITISFKSFWLRDSLSCCQVTLLTYIRPLCGPSLPRISLLSSPSRWWPFGPFWTIWCYEELSPCKPVPKSPKKVFVWYCHLVVISFSLISSKIPSKALREVTRVNQIM